jgi:hypothetical protein
MPNQVNGLYATENSTAFALNFPPALYNVWSGAFSGLSNGDTSIVANSTTGNLQLRPGIYRVDVSLVVECSANVEMQLYKNGALVPGCKAAIVGNASNPQSLNLTGVLAVKQGPLTAAPSDSTMVTLAGTVSPTAAATTDVLSDGSAGALLGLYASEYPASSSSSVGNVNMTVLEGQFIVTKID